MTEIGEYVVGACLRLIEECDAIEYNVIPRGGGIEGMGDLDVIGYRFKDNSVFICEVKTHLGGLCEGNSCSDTVKKLKDQHRRQKQYASKYLNMFENQHLMFWSPVVPKGKITEGLNEISGLELIINEEYTKKVDILKEIANKTISDIGNPFFRTLQLLQKLRRNV